MELPDGVAAWAVTDYATASTGLNHPGLLKNPKLWHALESGQVPETWPLLGVITMQTMLNFDGLDHKRLRSLVQKAFTRPRVEALRPRVEQIVDQLLDGLAATEPGSAVDLRAAFAFRVPMEVICELYGIDEPSTRDQLAAHCGALMDSRTKPNDMMAAYGGIQGIITNLIALKRSTPGEDLATALIAARDGDEKLSERELADTLFLMLLAGHETTQNLITNAVKSLLEHPEQLALVGSGAVDWSTVVEETLRFDGPVNTVMFRYAVEDLAIGGVIVRKGEPVLICLAAVGRDTGTEGLTDPEVFRLDRAVAPRHLAFGNGPHFCLGAPLARLEAVVALGHLFKRFPDLCCPVGTSSLERVPSLSTNSVRELPVALTALATL